MGSGSTASASSPNSALRPSHLSTCRPPDALRGAFSSWLQSAQLERYYRGLTKPQGPLSPQGHTVASAIRPHWHQHAVEVMMTRNRTLWFMGPRLPVWKPENCAGRVIGLAGILILALQILPMPLTQAQSINAFCCGIQLGAMRASWGICSCAGGGRCTYTESIRQVQLSRHYWLTSCALMSRFRPGSTLGSGSYYYQAIHKISGVRCSGGCTTPCASEGTFGMGYQQC